MAKKQLERWSPWVLLVLIIALWQAIFSFFSVSEFIFPSPYRIWTQFIEYKELIAGHAWRTFWVTMTGFGLAIVVGVMLGFLIGSSRVVWHRCGSGDFDGFFNFVFPHHGQHRHRVGDART
jgi:NitT/TauT family transport system permease protein